MELKEINEYFVCYLDLLGFSNLTENKKNNEIKRILKAFHKNIKNEITTNIKCEVISDSVFLFCEKQFLRELLFSLSEIFRKSIKDGVLLRGGLSFGECNYLKSELIENNIFGDAVSSAVRNEGKGKGCRIFIDETVPLNSDGKLTHLFQQYIVPTDFSYIDVFEWELVNKQDNFFYPNPSDFSNCENQLTSLIVSNLQLQNFILYSPKFSWNKKSQKGKEQLYASYVVLASSVKKIFGNFNKQFNLASDFSVLNNNKGNKVKLSQMNSILQEHSQSIEILSKYLGL